MIAMSRSVPPSRHPGMSDIIITGATGAIGRRVVRELVDNGRQVTGITRSRAGAERLEALGARAVEASPFDAAALRRAFDGAGAVVNLLTHIPPVAAMSQPGAWTENDRLRREASAAIGAAAAAAGAGRLVQESIALVYADGGDAWLDEDAPVEAADVTAAALVAEDHALRALPGAAVVLRFGVFMGPDSDQTLAQLAQARLGLSTRVAAGNAYVPTVWLDDAASAVVAALDVPAGIYNVADDDPPTSDEIDAALAAAVGREALHAPVVPPGPLPATLRALAPSRRVSNRRLRAASGWAPRVRAGVDGWALVAPRPVAA